MTPSGEGAEAESVVCGRIPRSEQVPTNSERADIVARIIAAADEETLELDEAGHLASLAYRAAQPGDLDRIGRRLDVADEAIRSATLRRQQWRSLVWLAVCALVAALMIVGLFYGLSPADPH